MFSLEFILFPVIKLHSHSFSKDIFIYLSIFNLVLCSCMYLHEFMHYICGGACEVQKKVSDSPELGLQALLATQPRCYARLSSTLDH